MMSNKQGLHEEVTPCCSPSNDGCEYWEQVGPDGDAGTVLAYLSQRYGHSSPAEWEARILSGRVLIDSRPAQSETLLRSGCELVWRRPPWIEPDAPRSFTVLYEDDDMLAVAKPAGLPTLPGAPFFLKGVRGLTPPRSTGSAGGHRAWYCALEILMPGRR